MTDDIMSTPCAVKTAANDRAEDYEYGSSCTTTSWMSDQQKPQNTLNHQAAGGRPRGARKGYGKRFSKTSSSTSNTKLFAGTSIWRDNEKNNDKDKEKEISGLFGRAKFGSSPSFDESAEIAMENSYCCATPVKGNEVNMKENKFMNGTKSNLSRSFGGGSGSTFRPLRSIHDIVKEEDESDFLSLNKKKRPNHHIPSSSASASSSISSSRSARARGNRASSRRAIFTPKQELSISEFDCEHEAGSRDLDEDTFLESPPIVGMRGAFKRGNAMLRRSHSVAGTSSLFNSQQVSEENVHPNESSHRVIRRASCLDKRPTMQRAATVETSEPSERPKRQTYSKKRTATSNTDHARRGLGFHNELKQSPPKFTAVQSSSLASVSSTSSSTSTGVLSGGIARVASEAKTEAEESVESFSSLAKRGRCQTWADGSNNDLLGSNTRKHHTRSYSAFGQSGHCTFSSSHFRSFSQPVGVDLTDFSMGSPSFMSPARSTASSVRTTSSRKRTMFSSSPLIDDEFCQDDEFSRHSSGSLSGGVSSYGGGSERVRSRSRIFSPPSLDQIHDEMPISTLKRTTSLPINMMSPFGGSCLNSELALVGNDDGLLDEKKKDDARDTVSDSWIQESDNDSVVSVSSNNSNLSSANDEEDDGSAEDACSDPKELSDAEIFNSKSSYEDFKYLTKELTKWAFREQKNSAFSASMGLNNGCMVAVKPNWTFEHKNNFIQWAVVSFGFKPGSVGGMQGGSFLRCSDVEGKEILAKLKRIMTGYKEGKFAPSKESVKCNSASKMKVDKNKQIPDATPEAQKLGPSLKLRPARRSSFSSIKQTKSDLMPFCDDFVGEMLADEMKNVNLNELKPSKNTKTPNGANVPQFVRSVSLQPLSARKTTSTLPCFQNSPMIETGCKKNRLSRRSEESAMNPNDFMSQIYTTDASPSPFQCRYRGERRNRFQQPPRPSFDKPILGLKPFESPHPKNCILNNTPSHIVETPMPKQIDHWGSRPILGKDWGASSHCEDEAIQRCTQVLAQSWLVSEFHSSEELCSKYQMFKCESEQNMLYECIDEYSDLGFDENASTGIASQVSCFDESSRTIGGSSMALLQLDDGTKNTEETPNRDRRRSKKLAKFARMSLCAATTDFLQPKRYIRFSKSPLKLDFQSRTEVPFESVMRSDAFSRILSFLNEGELIQSASLVCTKWADAATESLSNLMLISVGCDPSCMTEGDDDVSSNADEVDASDQRAASLDSLSIAKSMEKDWPSLMNCFPWARFLSDGAFKRVYKVWNDGISAYEALSVMDVDELNESGNLRLVGAELAVAVLLSSMSRRNICPNFVITRGVFTCQHEPPASHWGCKDIKAPRGNTYGGNSRMRKAREPKPGEHGNYQYIRMELCQHGDLEEFIKNLPKKMLAPWDCRNLLFQMAFALHVAGDRFGLKHYDVKLLNFFLQSAMEPTIAEEDHPHVVLRYGVGFSVFRLRMHPSCAFIAKLADYGTAVLRADADGQPVSLGQFTTIENTPPDFLILGNAAKQGYGHDCFGLGLCMLHLFTGHGPYEEILEDVVCPKNLKDKLRKIWKDSSYDVIWSVIIDGVDDEGNETEDETLYDTLYRFLVLFGIPEHQFCFKEHGKVWRAINSTLLDAKMSKCKKSPDVDIYQRDMKKFSLLKGDDRRIVIARERLEAMDGAMDLLLSLVSFDPEKRATPLDVINSKFMSALIEDTSVDYGNEDIVKSYTAYLTR